MPQGASAQQFLAVDSIREDVAVLKDGGVRSILMCSALNFALQASEEQDALIFQYQNFLNSLDFPVQFLIHSRKLNIAPYLERLAERQREEDNDLMKIQITEYMEFIKTFVGMTNIMSKTFYAVVPFTPTIVEKEGVLGGVLSTLGLKKSTAGEKPQGNAFEEYKNQLRQRVDAVVAGLGRLGIRAAPLNTEELIELFYGLYNPTEFEQIAAPPQERAAS